MSDWISYLDEDSGLGLELPADWRVADGVAGSELTILAPELGVEGFVANVTVTVQELEAPVDLEGYSAAALETMGRVLTDARLIDREGTTLLGREGERVLVAYRQGIHSLALEHWWSVAANRGRGRRRRRVGHLRFPRLRRLCRHVQPDCRQPHRRWRLNRRPATSWPSTAAS